MFLTGDRIVSIYFPICKILITFDPLKFNLKNMKLPLFFIAIGLIVVIGSCEKNDSNNDDTTKNSEARLLSVTCSFGEGIVDTTAHTVIIKAPESTDVTQIIPHFEISDGYGALSTR